MRSIQNIAKNNVRLNQKYGTNLTRKTLRTVQPLVLLKITYTLENQYLVCKFSTSWPTPIHNTLKNEKNQALSWLRPRMAYKRHRNLIELLQGDLNTKLNKGLISLDLCSRPCNCDNRSKVNGECAFKEKCRETFIIYEVKCRETGRRYISSTQQTFKKRMAGHFNDIQKMITKNLRSDSLATHFSNILPKNKNYQDKNYVH